MPEDNWKHRSSGMRCQTCIYFVVKDQVAVKSTASEASEMGKGLLGRCRRHAPTMNGWPANFEMDWCGDHKLDENKI